MNNQKKVIKLLIKSLKNVGVWSLKFKYSEKTGGEFGEKEEFK